MDGITKDIMGIISAVTIAPQECSECVAFCAEGRISCECRGDFHPKTCEHSSCYELESEE
jgi:hypothetical protein